MTTTTRFNIFNQVHKALRTLMFDTLVQIQQTDMSLTSPAATAAIDQTALLADIFDSHAYHEDTHIMAVAKVHDPVLVFEFENEHHIDENLTAELRAGIYAYKMAVLPEVKSEAAKNLYYALNAFVAFNLNHMNKEEQKLNAMLWANYTDDEIMEMEHNIVKNIAPEKMAIFSKWMIKGINNTELNLWLNAVKATAPEFVYQGLLQECANQLPKYRYDDLIAYQTAECLIA